MYSSKIVSVNRERLERSLGIPLREYTLEECREFTARLRPLTWPEGGSSGVIASLPEDVQRYIFNEVNLCKIDFRYWLQRYCVILDASKRLTPLTNLWEGQEKLLQLLAQLEEKDPSKPFKGQIIILKARQLGITAISQAICGHQVFLQPHTQAVIASDHPDNTLKLWQTLLRMYDNLPPWMRPVRDAKPKATNLHLSELDSDIVYGSGNQHTTLGQGMTVDVAHLSEVSTWIPECTIGIDADLLPAFMSSQKHHTLLMLESTGAGAKGNWFHDLFDAASKKKNSFTTIFIPWYLRSDWKRDSLGITLEDETLEMASRVKSETGKWLSKEQLCWWQATKQDFSSKDLLEVFYQEFSSTVEEAFQTGFRSCFSLTLRTKLRNQVKKPWKVYKWNNSSKTFKLVDLEEWWLSEDSEKWENHFIVWENKKPAFLYTVGVDASHGIEGGDNSAVEVLRVGNRKFPDEQVAEWCGNIDPVDLASVAWKIGHFFNADGFPAKMAVEVNPGSPGATTQVELIRRGYPHFYRWQRPFRADGKPSMEVGWWTTPGTRPYLTEGGVHAVKNQDLIINSIPFVGEMGTFVDTGIGKGRKILEHAPGCHDDRIMALFIAFEVSHRNDYGNIAEDRRKAAEQKLAPDPEVVQFQCMSEPPDVLWARWEAEVVDRILD